MIEKKVYEKIDVLSKYQIILGHVDPLRPSGKVDEVSGLAVYSHGPEVRIGEICRIFVSEDGAYLPCEVVGFDRDRVILMPMGPTYGIRPGSPVMATGRPLTVPLDDSLIGRILDGAGEPIDGKGAIFARTLRHTDQDPPSPSARPVIREPLSTGVRSIDGLLSVGRGQRIGIFSGSGVGKSSLLGMIARYTDADINVVALVGERGRELREFVDNDLGKEGLARSVVVTATSDQPAVYKIAAAMTATTIAEYFRDKGMAVNLLMDSVTRFAMAQREIGASTREAVITQGYTPSVFARLSRLVERAGTSEKGSITGFYTVLVEGDDLNNPVADAVRGYLDGHIVLDRRLASSGHYPAVDVLESVSRVMPKIVDTEHKGWADFFRKYMSAYRENEDFIKVGAYTTGSDPDVDLAIQISPMINQFLVQAIEDPSTYEETKNALRSIYDSVTAPAEDGVEIF